MSGYIKSAAKLAAVFAVTLALLAGLLVSSAFIPRGAVRGNMLSSAETLCENKVFFYLWDDVQASRIDRYADSILLSIAYCFDSGDPLRSVMRAGYYYTDMQNENENLRDMLTGGYEPTVQYMRYWHGSAAVVRAAHTFTDIGGMYVISAAVIAALNVLLLFMLIRRRLYACAAGIVCGLIAVGIWFVPFSLEYSWLFIITPAMAAVTVKLAEGRHWGILAAAFMVCGMLTSYLDFLTTETLSLTIPLLAALCIRKRGKAYQPRKNDLLFGVKHCALWGVGYAGMWVCKWITAAVVLGEDVTPYIADHIAKRLGSADEMYTIGYMAGSVWRNLTVLLPFGLGGAGIIAAIVILLGVLYVCFVYRRGNADIPAVLIYAAVAALPYIRYIVLCNHSYLHYFFTFRAQAAGVLAICLIVGEVVGGEAHARKRKHT
ncbi:MAG: hypothetical protein K5876_02015 [Ruminiclostridium sp.]|nr:hypothetical protein [Ruminiclostridium sp.]